MSIQSSVNATIGTIAAVKKAHDLGIQKQAMIRLDEQKLAYKQQKLQHEEYIAETKRKRLNLEVRKERNKEKGYATKTL